MPHLDRLSSLISNFEIKTQTDIRPEDANLAVFGIDGTPNTVWLSFGSAGLPEKPEAYMAVANVDYGGMANPILNALPTDISVDLKTFPELRALAELLTSEINTKRCGGQIALDRLCEFLLVSMLRKQIEANQSDSGLLAGLADPNLSPVLVAIHDQPGKPWKLDDLVELSAQSRSQFMETFQITLGTSPMFYLKQWRMTLARNALLDGARVKETARKFGYGSGDAFTRAFTQTYGMAPTKLLQVNQTG